MTLPVLRKFLRSVTPFLCAAVAAVTPACGEDLIQELKQVPYQIVYESYQDETWDLFTVRADGSQRVNLTRTPDVHELYPHVSPDGTKISFDADAGDGDSKTRDVYWMNFHGTGRRRAAPGARDGCWNADGNGIVYLKNEFENFTVMDYATKGTRLGARWEKAVRHDRRRAGLHQNTLSCGTAYLLAVPEPGTANQ